MRKTPLRRCGCKNCGKNFTYLTGAIFSNKQIKLGECFYIVTQLDKKSIKRLAMKLGHKWETINRLAKAFKESLNKNTPDPLLKG